MLANQPAAASAQRRANAHFSLTYGGAHQQYVGDVEARHEQHQPGQHGEGDGDARLA